MNILLIDNLEKIRQNIEYTFNKIETHNLTIATKDDDIPKIVKENSIDIVFLGIYSSKEEELNYIKQLKYRHYMVIAVSLDSDHIEKDKVIHFGAEDILTFPIHLKLLDKRINNYKQIMKAKNNLTFDIEAKNVFTKNVRARSIIFRTTNDESIALMRDYFFNEYPHEVIGIVDCMDIVYGFCQFLILSHNKTRVILEGNQTHSYITIEGIDKIPKSVISHIITKNSDKIIYKIDDNKITFKLNKVLSEIEDTFISKEEEQVLRAHFSYKTSAKEYVDFTPIDIMSNIEALEDIEDKIDLTIIDFEKNQEISSLYDMAESFQTYYSVISNLVEFDHIAFALEKISNFFNEMTEEKTDKDKNKKLTLVLNTVLLDLTSWRNTIFIKQETEDIHYMDSSLLNSFLQIEMIFDEKAQEDDNDILELF
ncbi:MAG: hypothetical protein OIF32_06190 [Campylobacterales bacterium]|nr:hypothetical protein [Campylobacterales bacterium]